jgi:hypothetical protein
MRTRGIRGIRMDDIHRDEHEDGIRMRDIRADGIRVRVDLLSFPVDFLEPLKYPLSDLRIY